MNVLQKKLNCILNSIQANMLYFKISQSLQLLFRTIRISKDLLIYFIKKRFFIAFIVFYKYYAKFFTVFSFLSYFRSYKLLSCQSVK